MGHIETLWLPEVGVALREGEPVPKREIAMYVVLFRPLIDTFSVRMGCRFQGIVSSSSIVVCNSQYQPKPSRVRGSTSGSRTNRVSAKRMRDMFGVSEEAVEYPSKRRATDPGDTRTGLDMSAMENWVSNITVTTRESPHSCPQANEVLAERNDPMTAVAYGGLDNTDGLEEVGRGSPVPV